MSSSFIPKDQIETVQPWKPNAFDRPAANDPVRAAEARTSAETTERKVQHVGREAYKQGFAAGYGEGQARARDEAARIADLADGLQVELVRADQSVAEDLLRLATELAQRIVRKEIAQDPAIVVPLVQDLIDCTPPFRGRAQLRLNPADAALVRDRLADRIEPGGWTIVDDATIGAGGCRIDTPSCQIDGTLENRWKRLMQALGQPTHWSGMDAGTPAVAPPPPGGSG